MDVASLGVMIPIVAIVMGIGSGMLKMWTNHQQEMARIRSASRAQVGEAAQGQFEDLRRELMALRDTTTQYDMSVEKALEEIRHRLTVVEGRTGASYRPVVAPEEQEESAILSTKTGG
jgi:TolA-binding protein